MTRWAERSAGVSSLLGAEIVRVLVGPEQREFAIHKKLLCTSSSYFRESIEAAPSPLSSTVPDLPAANRSTTPDESESDDDDLVMWLYGESPEMFELFILWLYQRHGFRTFIDKTISTVTADVEFSPQPMPKKEACCRALKWNLVKLHLFAALIDIPALQDVSMDALQDLYLRCDWDVSPGFINFLYAECDSDSAFRLRKWAVAMIAWTLANAGNQARGVPNAGHFQSLCSRHPDLKDDYNTHLVTMVSNKADMRIKNPQLRIPGNNLRNERRHFGFRQCSFHSHRKVVGQGRCPHTTTIRSPIAKPARTTGSTSPETSETQTKSDTSEPPFKGPILSPINVRFPGGSFLDLD